MSICRPVTGGPPVPAAAPPRGLAAQLDEARRLLRAAVPAGEWPAVSAEVRRLQEERGVPLLAALHAVHARIASGRRP